MRNKIFANFKMFRIYGTRNVSIRGAHIFWESRKLNFWYWSKNNRFFRLNIFLKMTNSRKKRLVKCVYMEKHIFWKSKNVSIWYWVKMFWISSTKFLLIFKCTGYPEHEMCVYGEAYIRHVTLSNCQRGQVKIWLKH